MFSTFSFGAVDVVTTTTDIAWAAKRIGGENVNVKSLLKGTENPHYVDAVPAFIRQVADADVVCMVGLELEVGWMPKILSKSGNAKVQTGGKGFCDLGSKVSVLEKPTGPVDRTMGDVHPGGNPHFWLSPKHFSDASEAIAQVLMSADPEKTAMYESGLKSLREHLDKVSSESKKRLAAVPKDAKFLEYHKEFSYFFAHYGLSSLGSLEEKPGVPPSAGRIAELALTAKKANVKLLIAGDTAPKKILERFSELSGIPHTVVPLSLEPARGLTEYQAHQEKLISAIVEGAGAKTP